MSERPNLDNSIDSKEFREYYYLKEELIEFCKKIVYNRQVEK